MQASGKHAVEWVTASQITQLWLHAWMPHIVAVLVGLVPTTQRPALAEGSDKLTPRVSVLPGQMRMHFVPSTGGVPQDSESRARLRTAVAGELPKIMVRAPMISPRWPAGDVICDVGGVGVDTDMLRLSL